MHTFILVISQETYIILYIMAISKFVNNNNILELYLSNTNKNGDDNDIDQIRELIGNVPLFGNGTNASNDDINLLIYKLETDNSIYCHFDKFTEIDLSNSIINNGIKTFNIDINNNILKIYFKESIVNYFNISCSDFYQILKIISFKFIPHITFCKTNTSSSY